MLPVAPSAIRPSGEAFIENENGEGQLAPFVAPRALQIEEMPYLVCQYWRGARNAMAAGFDGVEVHGANGYLLEQLIDSSANRRADPYGGPVENRARLLTEVVETVIEVWGSERVGVRLSPLSTFNDMTFGYIARKLNDQRLAYLHIVNPAAAALEQGTEPEPQALRMLEMFRETYRGALILAVMVVIVVQRRGQREAEGQAATRILAGSDPPAVRLDDRAADRETEPHAVALGRGERLEETIHHVPG
jgi:N-ethylmaleimide reductase